MKTADHSLLIHNGTIVDGTGAQPVRDGVVLVEAGKLAYVGPTADASHVPESVERIEARGGTIMPGLVEAHFHATYFNIAALEDLDIKYPIEFVSLVASINSKLAIECGYAENGS